MSKMRNYFKEFHTLPNEIKCLKEAEEHNNADEFVELFNERLLKGLMILEIEPKYSESYTSAGRSKLKNELTDREFELAAARAKECDYILTFNISPESILYYQLEPIDRTFDE